MSADWLNYHHLLYFWTVAREGSITKACDKLMLAQPTISGQLRKLEESLGGKLFDRVGRDLVLTELGRMTYKYADEIFTIGQELVDAVRGRPTGRPIRLAVGVPGVLPKLIVYKMLRPVLELPENIHLVCRQAAQDELLTMLAAHELDVVFSDIPAGALVRVKAFNHALGRSPVGIFGTQSLASQYGREFPNHIANAPWLLPSDSTTLRRTVDRWAYESSFSLNVVGEFDDTALMKVFAEAGRGLVALPSAIAAELEQQHGLVQLGLIPGATEDFFAISVEKKISHPGVALISDYARRHLFADHPAEFSDESSEDGEDNATELPADMSTHETHGHE